MIIKVLVFLSFIYGVTLLLSDDNIAIDEVNSVLVISIVNDSNNKIESDKQSQMQVLSIPVTQQEIDNKKWILKTQEALNILAHEYDSIHANLELRKIKQQEISEKLATYNAQILPIALEKMKRSK